MLTEIGNNSPREKEKMNDATNSFIEDYSNNAHECEGHQNHKTKHVLSLSEVLWMLLFLSGQVLWP
jgi:hypothetical protein